MTRNLHATWIADSVAAANKPIVFYEGVFRTLTLNLCSLPRNISWDSKTWLGNGYFLGWDGAEETCEANAAGCTVLLNGVPAAMLSLALTEMKQGAAGKLWLGFLDDNGAVKNTPYKFFQGKLDTMEIDEDPVRPMVKVMYETELVDFDRPQELRYSHEMQKVLYSGDTGFRYVEGLQKDTGQWGKQRTRKNKEKKKRGRGRN